MPFTLALVGALIAGSLGGNPPTASANPTWGLQAHELAPFDRLHGDLGSAIQALQAALQSGGPAPNLAATDELLHQLRFYPNEVARSAAHDDMLRVQVLMAALVWDPANPEPAQGRLDRAFERHAASPPALNVAVDPAFDELLKHRWGQASSKTGSIRIYCEMDCRAFVDGHAVAVENGDGDIPTVAGVHDVWVFDGESDGASFEVVEVPENGHPGVIVSMRMDLPPRPTTDQWWEASDSARRLEWGIAATQSISGVSPDVLALPLAALGDSTVVIARNLDLRMLQIRALATLANLQVIQGNPNAAAATLDHLVQLVHLDPSLAPKVDALVGRFKHLRTTMSQRKKPTLGTLELRCHQPCIATIEGFVSDERQITLPVGRYQVALFSRIEGVVKTEMVDITANGSHRIEFGIPPFQRPPLALPPAGASQKELRMAWGVAGGITLGGGVVWGLVAAGRAGSVEIRESDVDVGKMSRRTAGAIGGILAVHATVATIFFTRMPKSTKPGMPMVAAGAGLVGASLVAGGLAITAGLSADDAGEAIGYKRETISSIKFVAGVDETYIPNCQSTETLDFLLCDLERDIDRLEFRRRHGPTVAVTSGAFAAAMLITGSTLAIVGAARHHDFMQRPKRKRSRESRVMVSPSINPRAPGITFFGHF